MKIKKILKGDMSFMYSKAFLLVVSVIISASIWFYMAMSNMLDRPTYVYDVPITIELSDDALSSGVVIFDQSLSTSTVTVSGDALIIGRVTSSDVAVVASISPSADELANMTLTTDTIVLYGEKSGNVLANYDVEGVYPYEMTVTYDIYEEKTFTITNNINYTTDSNYYVSSLSLSETDVLISGPQSQIDEIGSVSVDLEVGSALTQSTTISTVINVYDKDGQIINLSDTFLEIDIDSVDVNFIIQNKQTVVLEVETQNIPNGFGDSRIIIDPETIDIAGDESVISAYETITLPDIIDFTDINLDNTEFVMSIPIPSSVYNISNIDTATVSFNLSGYAQSYITTTQIEIIGATDDKDISLVTRAVQVLIVAPSAISSSLSSENVFVTVDMTGYTSSNGDVEVPATVYIENADSAWVSGTYSLIVTVSDIEEIEE